MRTVVPFLKEIIYLLRNNHGLTGVSFFLKLQNLPLCSSFFLVKQALKGYKKGNFNVDRRKPITLGILKMLCSSTIQVCFSNFEAVS